MRNDMRVYGYDDNEPLITREEQIKRYIDSKLKELGNVDLSDVEEQLTSLQAISEQITESTETILETIATNKDECVTEVTENIETAIEEAKDEVIEKVEQVNVIDNTEKLEEVANHIIGHIEHAECHILSDLEEKFINLNETIGKSTTNEEESTIEP